MKCPTKKSAAKVAGDHFGVLIHNATRTRWDTRVFLSIAQEILSSRYSLSIVLIGDTRARTLNQTYRQKNTAANVLSFPLSPTVGEIYINLARVRREARSFDLSPHGYAAFLLIHGCLHLKGYDHSSKMERAEQRYIQQFALR